MQNGSAAAPSIRRLDEIDLRLLAALREDGRRSQEDLSRRLALSRPAVRERMRRLETIGVLLGYTIVVDWELLGYPILAFVNVRTAMGTCDEATRIVNALSDHCAIVEECHSITGEWCMLAKVRARTSRDLANFLDEIKKDPHFAATSTTLALATVSTT